MDLDRQKEIEILSEFMSEPRKKRIEDVLAERTQFLTIVLEDIYHPPNASAVLRSAECLGIQDIHIVENHKKYRPNSDVAIGASKWLNLYHYNNKEDNTTDCLEYLKEKGYCIVATTLEGEGEIHPPEALPLDAPLAICFGTEETGLSEKAIEMADLKVKIPMFGFTRSYNISVSAAIIIYVLSSKLRCSKNSDSQPNEIPWQLKKEVKEDLLLDWHRKCVKNYDDILNHILNREK